jgi:hypothetical protein
VVQKQISWIYLNDVLLSGWLKTKDILSWHTLSVLIILTQNTFFQSQYLIQTQKIINHYLSYQLNVHFIEIDNNEDDMNKIIKRVWTTKNDLPCFIFWNIKIIQFEVFDYKIYLLLMSELTSFSCYCAFKMIRNIVNNRWLTIFSFFHVIGSVCQWADSCTQTLKRA